MMSRDCLALVKQESALLPCVLLVQETAVLGDALRAMRLSAQLAGAYISEAAQKAAAAAREPAKQAEPAKPATGSATITPAQVGQLQEEGIGKGGATQTTMTETTTPLPAASESTPESEKGAGFRFATRPQVAKEEKEDISPGLPALR
jgi:hypothetical protein